jgi:phosphoheptose isomerase
MFNDYKKMINDALETIDSDILDHVTVSMGNCLALGISVYVCGNGGSAAVAEHLSCDFNKGISTDTSLNPSIISLVSNMSLISAIANDIGYDEIFSKQLEYIKQRIEGEVFLAISSSGNSPNIIKGLKKAKEMNMTTVAFVGFDGGQVVKDDLADYIIHVKSDNYGVVEDCHSIIMHSIAQYIRTTYVNHTNPLKL